MSTQTTDTELKELLEKFSRNSIVLDISEEVPITKGWTRFGGQPDVPPDFEWPTFKGENCESITKERPLSFLAQFDCSELSPVRLGRVAPRSWFAVVLLRSRLSTVGL